MLIGWLFDVFAFCVMMFLCLDCVCLLFEAWCFIVWDLDLCLIVVFVHFFFIVCVSFFIDIYKQIYTCVGVRVLIIDVLLIICVALMFVWFLFFDVLLFWCLYYYYYICWVSMCGLVFVLCDDFGYVNNYFVVFVLWFAVDGFDLRFLFLYFICVYI